MASDSISPSWQDLVAQKQRESKQKIPREWVLSGDLLTDLPQRLLEYDVPRRSGLLSETELDLTENYTASQLLVSLASGRVSALDVATAFCKRAAIAQQVVSFSVTFGT
jgi:amidase